MGHSSKKIYKMKDGGQALMDALKAKGYKKMGGGVDKPLVKMTMGGGADMVGTLIEGSQAMMRRGGEEYYKMGGQTGRSTYSGKKKKKKKK